MNPEINKHMEALVEAIGKELRPVPTFSKEKQWNELSFAEQQVCAACWGQLHMFDIVWLEVNVGDERFSEENALPWDAVGEIIERNGRRFLQLTGSQGCGGYGFLWSILLPEDVKLDFRYWADVR